jgi:hypothetical protein
MRLSIYILGTLLLLQSGVALAQQGIAKSYGNLFPLNGSRYQPAKLGQDPKSVHVNLLYLNAWGGNTVFNTRQAMDFFSAENSISQSEVFSEVRSKNNIFAGGFLIEPLNIGVTIRKPNSDGIREEQFSVSFGTAFRGEGDLFVSAETFELALAGNGAYEDKTISTNLDFGFYLAQEYTVGFSMPLPKIVENFDFRAGLRLKYLRGLAAVKTSIDQFDVYTSPYGREIRFNWNYNVSATIDPSKMDSILTEDPNSLLESPGKGFAFDLGLKVSGTTSLLALTSLT